MLYRPLLLPNISMLPTPLTAFIPEFSPWSAWWVTDDGFQVITIRHSSEFVANEELAKVHPALPSVMLLLKRERPGTHLATDSLSELFDLWDSRVFVHHENTHSVAMSEVTSLGYTKENVIFNGYGIGYQERVIMESPGKYVRLNIPTGITIDGAVVSKTWLETNHPGWFERLTAGQGLDLPLTESLTYALNGGGVEAANVLPSDLDVNL